MTFHLLRGPARRSVSVGGRPAACVPHDGMPAYESESGTLVVMETLVAFFGTGVTGAPLLLPRTYAMAAVRGRGLVALHDDPDAVWSWRPLIYSMKILSTQRLGSQQELAYRQALYEIKIATADLSDGEVRFVREQLAVLRRRYGRVPRLGPDGVGFRLPKNARKRLYREYRAHVEALPDETPLPYAEAEARARELLLENLSPQQRLDLATLDGFFVRGRVNRLYYVEPSNGFAIADPATHEPTVSLCLHPEEWIPHDDVALATKLAIDAGEETEAALLEAARPRILPVASAPTDRDRRALSLERRWNLYP